MPCKVNVFVQDRQTQLTTMHTTLLPRFFPDAGLEEMAAELEATMVRIVNESR